MRVCLVGDFSENLDEGYKNLSHYLADELESRVEMIRLDVKKIAGGEFWKRAISFRPQIFHIVTQPTLLSLLFILVIRPFCARIKVVVSVLRPERFFDGRCVWIKESMIKLAHPDLVFVQGQDAAAIFRALGCLVRQLPNGVDLDRFHPVDPDARTQLRRKYNIPAGAAVILHVGHLESARNLDKLIPLQSDRCQVVVVGSLYMGTNAALIEALEDKGFIIFRGYHPHVEEFYQLADCYVFPLEIGSSLSMPLSVLEAMASNLPVVSVRFEGLASAFDEGKGLMFVDRPEDIVHRVHMLMDAQQIALTREQVTPYSWEAVADKLLGYYQELLNDDKID